MKLGNLKISIFLIFVFFINTCTSFAADKIESVPLINLEELSPTFEEDKDVLEKVEDDENNLTTTKEENKKKNIKELKKIFINIKALDKITAKTSSIRLPIGENFFFGTLEIKALKCELSEQNEFTDTVAYLQVKDLSTKDNNQVFLFNGWTFVFKSYTRIN